MCNVIDYITTIFIVLFLFNNELQFVSNLPNTDYKRAKNNCKENVSSVSSN